MGRDQFRASRAEADSCLLREPGFHKMTLSRKTT
jgi:hypothetical protein